MDVHSFIFSPEPARPHFSFNVDGVDVVLVSLTCQLPNSPPSPPVLSPPPPAPNSPQGLPLTFGLRSLSSRLAVGVIAVLVLGQLAARLWQSRSVRVLRRLCCGDGTRSVISAAEGALDPSEGVDEGACWSVLFAINGREIELPLPYNIASNVAELKQALGELAGEALGPKATPVEWTGGDLRTMRVQYVDAQDNPIALRGTTRFREGRESPYLRVTRSSA